MFEEYIFMHGIRCFYTGCPVKVYPNLAFRADNIEERDYIQEFIIKELKFFCEKHFKKCEEMARVVTNDNITFVFKGEDKD